MPKRNGSRLACAALALALGACTGEARCETSGECASGERCEDGRCVQAPDAGPPCGAECECSADRECAASAACVQASCVEGACFFRLDHEACDAGERCDMTAGCVAVAADAGADPPDGGATVERDAAAPDAGPPGCDIASADPLFQPAGYTQRSVTWSEAFYGNPFPAIDSGGLAPLGSFTFRTSFTPSGPPMIGQYISVPFVPEADSNYLVKWYRSQAIPSRDYRVSYPSDAVYATISPCPGDFRLGDATVPRTDPLSESCRDYAADGRIYYGTTGGGQQCVLEAGRTYYLNVVFADPFGGLDPDETTCEHESGRCNANFGS